MADTELTIWLYLNKQIGNEYGTAGLMGNLRAESALNPINLQDTYNKKWNVTDEQFTSMVDNGQFDFTCNDKGAWGYGLAQWTSVGRRKNLYGYCKKKGTSIGDLVMQLEFLVNELKTSYKSVWNTLCKATSVKEASDVVLTKFEIPADQSDTAKNTRASYGQKFYDKYAKNVEEPVGDVTLYRVTAQSCLRIRKQPNIDSDILGALNRGAIFAVNEVKDNWGYCPTYKGWLCLDYAETK